MAVVVVLLAFAASARAQSGTEMYISWGYNANGYRPTDIHFTQSSLGNDFTLQDVSFHDSKGWTTGLLSHSVTGPQYNFQVGFFIRKNTAFEINFVHPKAIVTQDHTVRMTGTLNGAAVDQNIVLSTNVLMYKLNNGANFALFNVVRRVPLFRKPEQNGSVAALAKAGMGFVVPHTENTLFAQPNVPGFQFSGPDFGAEIAVRLNVFRGIFLEFCQKGVYASYHDLNIYSGSAEQDLWTHVSALSFGRDFRIGKK